MPPSGPSPQPEETCHITWKPDFRKWTLTPSSGPHPEPDEPRYVELQYDVMQLPAANSRQSTSINEAQSKHIIEQESELKSSSVCLPCRREGVTGVVPYRVI